MTLAAKPRNETLLAARAAGLRYVDPDDPGIKRRRRGGGFEYRATDGSRIADEATVSRIRSLAIPPAWTEVWICPSPRGHIQATGRDSRGRKQYRYHPLWQEMRDETKYSRTLAFARALPRLRRRVARDLRRTGLPREKVLAAAVRLLEVTLMRVGNEEYARTNRSFGLTTLRDRHARVGRGTLKLSFRGKGGRQHTVGLRDRRLARVVKACQDLPGQRLFQYLDEEGEAQHIDSDDVNAYLRDAMGDDFSAKDFRTWAGTVLAVRALHDPELRAAEEARGPTKRALNQAIEHVARELGNTPAVCRRCYIHPLVLDAYLDGRLSAARNAAPASQTGPLSRLRADERLVLSLLQRRRRQAA